MRRDEIKLLLILSVIFLLAFASVSFAIDPPHTATNDSNVNCVNCHNPSLYVGGSSIDNTPWNNVCWSCHNNTTAPYSDTHSAISTGDDVRKEYFNGVWTNECRTCHNPHTQEQPRSFTGQYPNGSWLVYLPIQSSTGNSGTGVSTITVAGNPWTTDQWKNYILLPRATSTQMYRILSNTSNTLTVDGYIFSFMRRSGSYFAIIYGKLIRSDFNTGYAIENSSGTVFNNGNTFYTVKFYNASGPHSAGNTGDESNPDTNAVCIVCHSKTGHMNIGFAMYNTTFDTKPAGYAHYTSNSEPCWNSSCHSQAADGFAAGCTTCHGYPPVDNTSLLGVNAPYGSTGRGTDYANGAGAHNTHVNTQGLDCGKCHEGGGPNGSHNQDPNPTIHVGFNIFGGLGGNYSAPAFSNASYALSAGGTTTYTQTGVPGNPRTCDNIYCHSTVQANGGVGAPTYKTPTWDGSVQCGDCHNADGVQGTATTMDSGSHTAHLNQGFTCDDCHSGNSHVDNSIDVTVGSYSAGGAPRNGYGQCTTASCHDNGTGATVTTPTWGTTVNDCSECHATQPSTGSHSAHLALTTISCGNCHDSAVQATTAPTEHLDGNIDVYDTTPGDLGYPQDKTKNTAYSQCTNASCHDNGTGTKVTTPTWGSTGVTCNACHATQPATGSHTAHLAVTGVSCGNCHDGAVEGTTFPEQHSDNNIDVYDVTPGDLGYPQDKTKNTPYSQCTNASCHDNGTGARVTTPTWGTTISDCSECHATQPASGSHTAHLALSGVSCGNCHDSAVEGTTPPTQHLDGNIDVYDVAAGDLGYPQDKTKNTLYSQCTNASCHDNGTGSKVTTPTWGTTISDCSECHATQPASGSHTAHLSVSGVSCGNCHDSAVQGTTPPTQHLDGNIDVYDVASGDLGYPADKTKNTAYSQCSNASCHDNGTGTKVTTPTWGTTISDCSECHATQPASGSHTAHLSVSGVSCGNCHDSAVQGTTAPTQHLDGNIDVYDVASGDLGYPADKTKNTAYSQCSNASCHDNGTGTKVTTPTWGTTISDCSECHATQPASGSHTAHLAHTEVNCGNCHDSAVEGTTAPDQHLDGNIDVYDVTSGDLGYPANKTKNTPYDKCNNALCHDDGTGALVVTPTWGTVSVCDECHSYEPATGSHTAHLAVSFIDCGNCHGDAIKGTQDSGVEHRDANVDVFDVNPGDLGYPPDKTKNTPYTQCTNAYCHENGRLTKVTTPTWGTTVTDCSECHATQPATGSHTAHLAVSGVSCGNCHDSAVQGTTAPTEHLDGNVDVYDVATGDLGYPADKTKNTAFSQCSNASCHDNGTGTKVTTPTWGTTISDCSECHATQPASGSHTAHLSVSGVSCGNCHDSAVQGTTPPTQHLDGNIDVYDVASGDLGYPADKTKNTAYSQCSNASCHDNGTGTKVTTPTWGTTISDCSECHATQPASGSHTAHLSVSGVSCGNCHDSAVQGTTPPTQHLDGNIDVYDVASGDLGYPANKTKNTAYSQCSNASCHDNGTGTKVTTPTWGTTVSNCTECHAQQPATGSHTAHLAVSSVSCSNCHDSAVEGTTPPEQHLDGNIDVYDVTSGDLGYPQNKTENTAFDKCSNASCHDNGTGTKVTTPTWGTTVNDCSECHATQPTSGSHTAHLAYTANITCTNCHGDAVQGTSAITGQHVDGNIDVFDVTSGDLGYPQNKTKNTAYSQCTNINCHGSSSPTWGTTNTGGTCTVCHGTFGDAGATEDKIAPPDDTAGNSLNTDPKVGAHQAHLNSAVYGTFANTTSMNCSLCHQKPTNVFDSGHLDATLAWDGQADVTLGSLATQGGASPTYTGGPGGTCSNVYCHDARVWDGGVDNATSIDFPQPDWNTPMLTDEASPPGPCDNCHGYPPGGPGKHYGTDCSGCHYTNTQGDFVATDNVSFTNPQLHIDGSVTAKGDCDSCHGFPPIPGDGKNGAGTANDGGKGAHWSLATDGAHIDNSVLDPTTAVYNGAGTEQCAVCHIMPDTNHPNGAWEGISVGVANSFDGGTPTYGGVRGEKTTPKSCSNVNCHFGTPSPRWSCPTDPPE